LKLVALEPPLEAALEPVLELSRLRSQLPEFEDLVPVEVNVPD
jgi:hypothetical protein